MTGRPSLLPRSGPPVRSADHCAYPDRTLAVRSPYRSLDSASPCLNLSPSMQRCLPRSRSISLPQCPTLPAIWMSKTIGDPDDSLSPTVSNPLPCSPRAVLTGGWMPMRGSARGPYTGAPVHPLHRSTFPLRLRFPVPQPEYAEEALSAPASHESSMPHRVRRESHPSPPLRPVSSLPHLADPDRGLKNC